MCRQCVFRFASCWHDDSDRLHTLTFVIIIGKLTVEQRQSSEESISSALVYLHTFVGNKNWRLDMPNGSVGQSSRQTVCCHIGTVHRAVCKRNRSNECKLVRGRERNRDRKRKRKDRKRVKESGRERKRGEMKRIGDG